MRRNMVSLLIASASLASSSLAQPTTVYVYNQRATDSFDNAAEGFVFSQLGLLDANGRPINPIPESQIIRDPGNNSIVGYRSADGTRAAYDVNSKATTNQAWNAVANGGTLHIVKHGMKYIDANPGTPPAGCGNNTLTPPESCDPPGAQAQCPAGQTCGPHCKCCGNGVVEAGETCDPNPCPTGNICNHCRCEGRGGGIRLDGGRLYDGFGNGTGVGYNESGGMAYPLDPRPGANINIHINSCWSSNDPDGTGGERSVTESAEDVDGVAGATGNPAPIYTHCNVELTGGTPAQQTAALNALRAAARAAGFPPVPAGGGTQPATTDADVAKWVCSLPMRTRHDTTQGIINAAMDPDNVVGIRVTFNKDANPGPGGAIGGDSGTCENVTQCQPESYEEYPFTYGNYPAALLTVQPLTMNNPFVLLGNQLGESPAPMPPGLQLASGIFMFENLGYGEQVGPALVEFGYVGNNPLDIQVLWYSPMTGQWLPPLGAANVNPSNNTVQVQTQQLGAFAAFAPASAEIPAAGHAAIVVLVVLLALGGWVVLRRRVSANATM